MYGVHDCDIGEVVLLGALFLFPSSLADSTDTGDMCLPWNHFDQWGKGSRYPVGNQLPSTPGEMKSIITRSGKQREMTCPVDDMTVWQFILR